MKRKEVWKKLPGYSGLYIVSNKGRVISNHRKNPVVLKPIKDNNGYLEVHLSKRGVSKKTPIHRCVLASFVGPSSLSTRHLDGNKKNNCLENLLYGDASDNYKDKVLHGTHNKGIRHGKVKLKEDDVLFIKEFHTPHDRIYGSSALARRFNVCPSTIAYVVYNGWKHLNKKAK